MKPNVKVVIWMMLLVLIVATQTFAYTGIVSIDTVSAQAGQKIIVPIRLSNSDQPISGISIPLKIMSPYLTVDSVSFSGAVKPADFVGYVYPTGAIGDTVEVTYSPSFTFPIPVMSVNSGLIATLHITVSSSTPAGFIPIDSISIDTFISDGGPSNVRYWKKVNATDNLGNTILPGFIGGGVQVRMPTDIGDDNPNGLPTGFGLSQNYPNPFNPATLIEFALPKTGNVRLEVFNILGQSVSILIDRKLEAGHHQVEFDASKLPSGVYFYRLSHLSGVETKKMTLVK